jgi:hypothetical protein
LVSGVFYDIESGIKAAAGPITSLSFQGDKKKCCLIICSGRLFTFFY